MVGNVEKNGKHARAGSDPDEMNHCQPMQKSKHRHDGEKQRTPGIGHDHNRAAAKTIRNDAGAQTEKEDRRGADGREDAHLDRSRSQKDYRS